MKSIYCLLLISISLLTQADITAQESSAVISFDRSEIMIGEQVEALIEISFPVTTDYQFPVFSDTLTSKLEIVQMSPVESNYRGNNLSTKVLSQKLVITSFDTGFHTVPPIYFAGKTDSLKTEPVLLTVKSVKVDMPAQTGTDQPAEVEIKDIKDIHSANFSLWEWIKENYLWILLFLLLAAAAWSYFKFIHPRLQEKGISAIVPEKIIPPYEIALEKLKSLEEKKLWQSGKVKLYHSEISEIVREYIENQLKIPALEFTTLEIMSALQKISLNDEIKNEIKQMLQLADLVKFAKYQPIPSENEDSIKSAKHFIISTKPEEKIEVKNV